MRAPIADRSTRTSVDVRVAPRTRNVLIPIAGMALSGLALLVSGLLLRIHVTAGLAGCAVGGMDCGEVVLTDFGYVFGLPLPVMLIPYYTGLLFMFAHAGFGERGRRVGVSRPLRWATTFALLPSLVLLLVSVVALQHLCPMCLMLDGFNLGLFVCARRLELPRAGRQVALPALHRIAWFGSAVTMAAIAAFTVWALREDPRAGGAEAQTSASLAVDVHAAPRLTAVLSPTCPHCAALWADLPGLVADLGGDGRPFGLEIDLLPNSQDCFDALEVPTTRRGHSIAACRSAVHAVCARSLGRLRPFLDALYLEVARGTGEGLGHPQLTTMWATAGLDFEAMSHCTGDTRGRWSVDDASDTARAALREHLLGQGPRLHDDDFVVPRIYVDGQPLQWDGRRGIDNLREALTEGWAAATTRH